MASVFSHAVAALGIAACFYQPRAPKRVWVIGALCSVIPDLDVIGFGFGVHYGDFWGHRGFTHSLFFAALLASVVTLLAFRQAVPGFSGFSLWTYFFLAIASHGLLDAMTDGGLGVAFFSPFLEADSRLADRCQPFLHRPGPGSCEERTILDLASGSASSGLGLADSPAICAFRLA